MICSLQVAAPKSRLDGNNYFIGAPGNPKKRQFASRWDGLERGEGFSQLSKAFYES